MTHKIPGTPECRGAVSTDVESDFNPMGSNNLKRNDSMNWMTHSKLPQRSGSIGNGGYPDWSRSQSSSRSSRCNSAQASTNRSNDDFGELRDFRHLFSLLHGFCQRNPAGNVTNSTSVSKIRIGTDRRPILLLRVFPIGLSNSISTNECRFANQRSAVRASILPVSLRCLC